MSSSENSLPQIRNKKTRELAVLAVDSGWIWRISKKGHLLFISPNGKTVTISTKRGDPRMSRNIRADFRRAGLQT